MATRREVVEAVLFLPAMALLAALAFGIFAGIIYAASWLFETISVLLDPILPRPLNFAVTVLSVAAIVGGLGTVAVNGWSRRRS